MKLSKYANGPEYAIMSELRQKQKQYLTITTSCFSISTYIKQMSCTVCPECETTPRVLDFGRAFNTFATIPATTSLQHLNVKRIYF